MGSPDLRVRCVGYDTKPRQDYAVYKLELTDGAGGTGGVNGVNGVGGAVVHTTYRRWRECIAFREQFVLLRGRTRTASLPKLPEKHLIMNKLDESLLQSRQRHLDTFFGALVVDKEVLRFVGYKYDGSADGTNGKNGPIKNGVGDVDGAGGGGGSGGSGGSGGGVRGDTFHLERVSEHGHDIHFDDFHGLDFRASLGGGGDGAAAEASQSSSFFGLQRPTISLPVGLAAGVATHVGAERLLEAAAAALDANTNDVTCGGTFEEACMAAFGVGVLSAAIVAVGDAKTDQTQLSATVALGVKMSMAVAPVLLIALIACGVLGPQFASGYCLAGLVAILALWLAEESARSGGRKKVSMLAGTSTDGVGGGSASDKTTKTVAMKQGSGGRAEENPSPSSVASPAVLGAPGSLAKSPGRQRAYTYEDLGVETQFRYKNASEVATEKEIELFKKEAERAEDGIFKFGNAQKADLVAMGFTPEASKNNGAVKIWSRREPNGVKTWQASCTLPFAASHAWHNIASIPVHASWNSTVLEYYSVAPLEHNTDLTYTAACSDCGGLVSSRDFYIARRVAKRNLPDGRVSFGSGGVSVPVASDQGRPSRTRGWNDVSGFVVIAPPDDAESCSVVWVINSDLRGWVS